MTKYIREAEVDLMIKNKELRETNKFCRKQLIALMKASNKKVAGMNLELEQCKEAYQTASEGQPLTPVIESHINQNIMAENKRLSCKCIEQQYVINKMIEESQEEN